MNATTNSVIPYVGSKIILTTYNNVKYEGILISINTVKGKIAMKNVTMKIMNEKGETIETKNDSLDYIIFHGRQIKNLEITDTNYKSKKPGDNQKTDKKIDDMMDSRHLDSSECSKNDNKFFNYSKSNLNSFREEIQLDEITQIYDKSNNFFDNIGSSQLKKEKFDKQQRMIRDAETFGYNKKAKNYTNRHQNRKNQRSNNKGTPWNRHV